MFAYKLDCLAPRFWNLDAEGNNCARKINDILIMIAMLYIICMISLFHIAIDHTLKVPLKYS